ncbi:MAG: nuclear transport factor 2 family protein [Oceanicaulis sp.]
MARKAKPGGDVQMTGDRALAREIADARARFNQALAERDFEAIAAVLAEGCTLVPGDDADLMDGRDAQLGAWRSIFAQAPNVTYVRTPRRIDVAEDGLLAAEAGRWRGAWSADGVSARYSGAYFAKWRQDGGDWRIASEVFVTLSREVGAG